jgi:hypothetical protein
MGKKVLVLYYSQSGQLGDIVNNFVQPFRDSDVALEIIRIKPKKDFHFPWTSDSFFDAMPESVLGVSVELESFQLNESKYDLVIFAYQPWFLSPSIPSASILNHPKIKSLLKNTPVLTIIGARNMWLNAQEKVKKYLKEAEAHLVGNIALVDNNNNLLSAITILYWMLTGKRDKMWGIFPKPGVADEDVAKAREYGSVSYQSLKSGEWNGLQKKLVEMKAVEVKSSLMFIEARAGKLFSIWANVITRRKKRSLWLKIFKYYLLFALFIVAPIVLTINNLFFRPFFGKAIHRKKQYYLGLN